MIDVETVEVVDVVVEVDVLAQEMGVSVSSWAEAEALGEAACKAVEAALWSRGLTGAVDWKRGGAGHVLPVEDLDARDAALSALEALARGGKILREPLTVNLYTDPWRPGRRTEEATLPAGTPVRRISRLLDDWEPGDPEPWGLQAYLGGSWVSARAWRKPKTWGGQP